MNHNATSALMQDARKQKKIERAKTVHSFLHNQGTILGMILVILVLLLSVFGPILTPYSIEQMGPDTLLGPSAAHLFGTDLFGRDVLSRSLSGMRLSLIIGLSGAGISMVAGLVIGLVAGFYGGKIDHVIMAVSDIFQAIPVLLFAICIMAILGNGTSNMIIAIAVTFTPSTVRVTRGQVLSLKNREFIEATRALGIRGWKVLFRHLLPNVLAPVIVMSTISIGNAILIESSLAFIGLGPQIPDATLGTIIADGRSYVSTAWWISSLPGILIVLIVMGFNLFGDGLRDLADHRGA